jgi:WD40 repeat protein
VLLVQNARVERGASQMHSLLVKQYEDQGRRLILADDPMLALAYLHEASRLGAHGPAHDFLLAQALRATDGELFVLMHDGMVGRVRFSPDGSIVATGSMDGHARLWNARTGSLIAKLDCGAPSVRIEWSPRGDRLAAGAASGVIKLWDARGRLLRELHHDAGIETLLFTPDGSRLVTTTVQDEIAVWDPASGERMAVLQAAQEGPPSAARSSVAISRDGALVAGGDRSGKVSLWRLADHQPIASWSAHQGEASRVEFSPDASLLVTLGDREAIVWAVDSHQVVAKMSHEGGMRAATFSPDGTRLLTASDDRTAAIWDARSGKRLHTLSGHLGGVWEAIWSPDGRLLATASDDGTASMWEAASGRRVAHRVGHRGSLRDIAFDAAGTRVATVSLDRKAIVWSTQPSQMVTVLAGHTGDILSAEFSPRGEHVLTAGTDGTARVWDATTGRPLLSLTHPRDAIATFSPDGRRIATACDDGIVRFWDARSGARVLETATVSQTLSELRWSGTGDEVAAIDGDGAVRIWSAETGELRRIIRDSEDRRFHWVAFHPTRPLLLTNGDEGGSQLWERATGRLVARFADDQLRNLGSIDPTGRRVVTTTPSRTARIWNIDDGRFERELVGHVGNVLNARWGKSADFVLTYGFDGTARIWDASDGRMLAVLGSGNTAVFAAAFAPDMTRVVIAGAAGLAEIWELPTLEQSPSRVDEIARCRAPYTMEGDDLVPRTRASSCGNASH